MRGGSTASVVYVKGGCAYFAHAGDSRAVLLNSQGDDIFATKDHKPDRWDEGERIKSAKERLFAKMAYGVLMDLPHHEQLVIIMLKKRSQARLLQSQSMQKLNYRLKIPILFLSPLMGYGML